MPRRKLSGFAILVVRITYSLIIAGVMTGVNVFQLLLQNPFTFREVLWVEISKAGNIFLIVFLLWLSYVTNLDKPLLEWLERHMT